MAAWWGSALTAHNDCSAALLALQCLCEACPISAICTDRL